MELESNLLQYNMQMLKILSMRKRVNIKTRTGVDSKHAKGSI